jgi:hypothetical protein
MHWKVPAPDKFIARDVAAKAATAGWKHIDTLHFSRTDIRMWREHGKPVFPLTFRGFIPNYGADRSSDSGTVRFPRWIDSDCQVLVFKTGWVKTTFDDEHSDESGFVVLSKDGTEMSVYHLWGD